MRVLIDADACPVADAAIRVARERGLAVVLVCDSAHSMEREGAQTVTVTQGADSADFRIVNMACPGDIVITQDYGLAAMCLARGARALNQNGMIYDDGNIDALLMSRHVARKARNAGMRTKGPPKRTRADDERFLRSLERILSAPHPPAQQT